MRLAVIGTGYVGLVSGACFAEIGHDVVCVDNDAQKIEALKKGDIPIYEPGLDALVVGNVGMGRLEFLTDLAQAVKGADAVFIAVGTPPDGADGGADLSYVYAVAKELAGAIDAGTVVVTKSTVPVGTGDEVARIIAEKNPELEFNIVSNPEFLREGCAIDDFLRPDRVVVGCDSEKAKSTMEEIYKPLSAKGFPVFYTDVKSAELAKYAANAFLATKIGFINEISDICEVVGADIESVASAMGMDKRIGRNHLYPGPGFGGSCFPKDTLALRKIASDCNVPSKIVDAVIYSNERRKLNMAEKVIKACGGDVKNKVIAVLGLAFKANTDDIRYSPALMILPILRRAGAHLQIYDPEAMQQAKKSLSVGETSWCIDSYDAMKGADAVVILTEWAEFRELDLQKAKSALKTPLMIDLRNLFEPETMLQSGFAYVSIGREPVDLAS